MNTLQIYSYTSGEEKIYVNTSHYPNGFGEHKHDFLEIVFILAGSAVHVLNGHQYSVMHGDLFMLDYNDTHTFIEQSENFRIITCSFLPELLDESLVNSENAADILRLVLAREFHENVDYRFNLNLLSRHTEFESILKEMDREFNGRAVGYQAVLKGYLIILLSRIFRYASEKNSLTKKGRENKTIQKVIDHLKQNYAKPFSLEEIARLALLSPNYLSSVFKNATGISLTDYIHKLRIDEACSLLSSPNLSVHDVMNEIGYSDSKFFYQIFKRYTGMTPGEFKKRRLSNI